ncbi:hypothetical protein ACP70R_002613 [Stipagrostis hirtigluma subsp. patula]
MASSRGRGSIAAFATYRPPCPWDIFSCPNPPSGEKDEVNLLQSGSSDHYNHNARPIPAAALKALIAKKPELASECGATADDVDSGRATGLVFVSERENGLETLHVALCFNDKVKVLSLGEIYGADTFGGVRMEDSGCFGGGFAPNADPCIIYVSTKKPAEKRRTPWTVVYRTNLKTGETEQLTPDGQYDLSPAVSPSGKRVAVANFRGNRWDGEIEHLKTDIVLMNVDRKAQGGKLERKRYITNAGWPSWGSDNIIFFHRAVYTKDDPNSKTETRHWGVYRYDIAAAKEPILVTPIKKEAMTPAAISETKVAVAIIENKMFQMGGGVRTQDMYRHIEIYDVSAPNQPVKITQVVRPMADHYSPFVLDGGRRIGYHRARAERLLELTGQSNVARKFNKLQSPHNDVDLFRVSGVFPSVCTDGSKLAFVDNEFKAVWIADKQGLRCVWERRGSNSVFSTMWNQNPELDILYVCVGPAFKADNPLDIYAIFNASGDQREYRKLTGRANNAFPYSNPEGNKIVFRSTRDHADNKKNLYILEDAHAGEEGGVTRLTNGNWTDTHCQWAPKGDWVVFSSTRDKPAGAADFDNGLDFGYFSVFIVSVAKPDVVVRVMTSAPPMPGVGSTAGHVNHPVFSPDGRSIVVTSDLAAVSAEPISMPMFLHSVRPYGDIFSFDIDPTDITKNRDIQKFHRVTHSRYEYSTPVWTKFATNDPNAQWNMLVPADSRAANYKPACPYMQADGGQSLHMTGHLVIPRRCC